jgi:hypothetical protein
MKKELIKASSLIGVLTGCLALSFYFGYKFNEYDRNTLIGLGEAKNQIIFSLQEDISKLTSKVNACSNVFSAEYVDKLEKDNLNLKNELFSTQQSLNTTIKSFNDYAFTSEKEIIELEGFKEKYEKCVANYKTYKNAGKLTKIKRVFK